MAPDPKTQQILIAAGVVLVVVILILCVFTPWNRMGTPITEPTTVPAVQHRTDSDSDDESEDESEPEDTNETGNDSSNTNEIGGGSSAHDRAQIRDEQSRHRQALTMSRAPGRRVSAPPTTSAVMLAAMRSPARSRTAAGSMDYPVDDYNIDSIKPAELGRQ